jgi:uncharacterized secreted repeat protein (TIGR03808 family)
MNLRMNRRGALGALTFAALGPGLLSGHKVRAQTLRGALEGGIDATHEGLNPGSPDDQSKAFAKALGTAGADGRPLFLPPGRYELSEIALPAITQIVGVPGQSRVVLRGGSAIFKARHATTLRLEGVTLDGAGRPLGSNEAALLDVEDVGDLVLDDCDFLQSGSAGARLRGCAGRVENSRFQSIGTKGLVLDQSRGMRASGNVVSDCGDTGILVSRDEEGEDGTIVTENRVSHVRADSGGTGQNGNGINLDKANGVVIADNRVDDCAFSAIRCFSSDSLTVTGNIATRSGEMALYVEFAWEGAVVSSNLIDGGNGGISFTNFAEHGGRLGVCSDNIIRNIRGGPTYPDGNLQNGAGIAAEADVAITGNVIEDAIWGLQLGWGPYLRDVTATGNVIRRTRIGIAVSVVEGVGPAIVANNLISDASQGAILGMKWADVATGELVDGGDIPKGLTVANNRSG